MTPGLSIAILDGANNPRKQPVKDESDSPPQIVFNFLTSLPVTIKGYVQPLVWFYVQRQTPQSAEILEADIGQLLLEGGRAQRFGALICIVAVIDYILSSAMSEATTRDDFLRELANEDPSFEPFALQAPLKTRHFESAWSRWSALRKDVLAPEMLHDFEGILRRER
jgi:hypothetical protein